MKLQWLSYWETFCIWLLILFRSYHFATCSYMWGCICIWDSKVLKWLYVRLYLYMGQQGGEVAICEAVFVYGTRWWSGYMWSCICIWDHKVVKWLYVRLYLCMGPQGGEVAICEAVFVYRTARWWSGCMWGCICV